MLTVEYAKDPFYNDPNNITVFLTVKFVEMADELPFTATPYDDMPYGVELCTNAKNGDYGTVRPWTENPHYVSPSVSPQSLPNAQKDVGYTQALDGVNAGTPYVITAIDALPNGLSIANNTITGTPTVTGDFSFKVQITDSLNDTGETTLTLTIS